MGLNYYSNPKINAKIQPLLVTPFTFGSEELKKCLRQTLGSQAFNEIAQEKRAPSGQEAQQAESWFQKYGQRGSSPSQYLSAADLVSPEKLTRRYPNFIKYSPIAEPRLLRMTLI